MKRTIVWIDHEKTYIYDYGLAGIHPRKHSPKYEGPVDHGQRSNEHEKKFYHELAHSIEDSNLVLLMGPGMAKEEFKNHCETHHPKVNEAIFKVATLKDHPSQEEILGHSNKIFKEYFDWNGL